jgi:hypothetical protein
MSIKIQINTDKIKSFNPCKDRFDNWVEQYGDFNGDILDFLDLDKITETDKIWVAVRVLPREQVEYFAIDSAFAAAYASASSAASSAAYASASYSASSAAAYAAYAADAAYAASSAAAYAADAAYAAYAADAYAADAAYSASSAADYASAAAYAADYASAAARKKERERQIKALIYLISTGDE